MRAKFLIATVATLSLGAAVASAEPGQSAGRFSGSVAGGFAAPLGSLGSGLSQSELFDTGLALDLDLAAGVSRTVSLGAWGQALVLPADDRCEDCSLKSLAFGPLVRYHLVQGTRFDPWAAAGAGVRLSTVKQLGQEQSYTGVDWLRIVVGGDWYAASNIGFGPLLQLGLSSYFDRPSEAGSARLAWYLGSGLRLSLQIPGR